jgi:hypothetical protein
LSIFAIGARFAQAFAIKVAYVGLVVAVKRFASLVTTIIGRELCHEKNIMRKAGACLIIIFGMIMV